MPVHYLSVVCADIFVVEPGSDVEVKAKRKGMLLVPPADLDRVQAMGRHERRRWFVETMNARPSDG